jgi:predicted AlkP superfamily phosphohydrolase/phosphomutase
VAPDFVFDIEGFRSLSEKVLLERAAQGLKARFRFARALARQVPWDFFVMTDIGTDRVQHGLWSNDRDWGEAVQDYYRLVDEELGRWLEELPDDTCLWIVSDHGAQACRGTVSLNEWLREHGWLKLRKEPQGPQALLPSIVEWKETIAWAEGGYVGRIYINVRGRQPEGVVHPADLARVCAELRAALAAGLVDAAGARVPVAVYSPAELYRECQGFPPDLFVYADQLRFRLVGTVGVRDTSAPENESRRDRANHHHAGVFISYDPKARASGEVPRPVSLLSLRQCIEAQLLGDPLPIGS